MKKFCNSHNNVVYVRKKMKKVEVPDEIVFYKTEAFPKEKLVSVEI